MISLRKTPSSFLWTLSKTTVLVVISFLGLSCSRIAETSDEMEIMSQPLISLSDTIQSRNLADSQQQLYVYLPKVGCSSCNDKDIAFIETFIYRFNHKRVAIITNLVNAREQRLLEQRLNVKVYRAFNHNEPLFGKDTHDEGMIFMMKEHGMAHHIFKLRYDVEEAVKYCDIMRSIYPILK